jgi:hypothetical protein
MDSSDDIGFPPNGDGMSYDEDVSPQGIMVEVFIIGTA